MGMIDGKKSFICSLNYSIPRLVEPACRMGREGIKGDDYYHLAPTLVVALLLPKEERVVVSSPPMLGGVPKAGR